jgi:hypothetical protein
MGIISGWGCHASRIDIIIDEVATLEAAYGTDREDTVKACGDANNGFGLLVNWSLFKAGGHTIHARADGVEFGSATFTVTTLMEEEFLWGAEGSYRLSGFPYPFTDVVIRWEQSLQNFVIESIDLNLPGVGAVGP